VRGAYHLTFGEYLLIPSGKVCILVRVNTYESSHDDGGTGVTQQMKMKKKGKRGNSKRHTCHTLNFVAHPKMGHEHNFWGDKDVFRRMMESAGFVIGMSKRKYLEIFMPYIAR
jgi:ABC-type histidine transport system ATPase subunit